MHYGFLSLFYKWQRSSLTWGKTRHAQHFTFSNVFLRQRQPLEEAICSIFRYSGRLNRTFSVRNLQILKLAKNSNVQKRCFIPERIPLLGMIACGHVSRKPLDRNTSTSTSTTLSIQFRSQNNQFSLLLTSSIGVHRYEIAVKCNTAEALLTDTLVSGQVYLRTLSQNPVFTPIQTLYFTFS